MDTLTLAHEERRRLRGRALRAQQRDQSEVAGALVVDESRRIRFQFMRNRSSSPGHFELDPVEYRAVCAAARAAGKRVVGTFHSHPIGSAVPGPGDVRRAKLNSVMLVYDVCARQMMLWRIVKAGQTRKVKPIHLWLLSRVRSGVGFIG